MVPRLHQREATQRDTDWPKAERSRCGTLFPHLFVQLRVGVGAGARSEWRRIPCWLPICWHWSIRTRVDPMWPLRRRPLLTRYQDRKPRRSGRGKGVRGASAPERRAPTTVLAMLHWLGIESSYSLAARAVSDDNPCAEALLRTAKLRRGGTVIYGIDSLHSFIEYGIYFKCSCRILIDGILLCADQFVAETTQLIYHAQPIASSLVKRVEADLDLD